ncbi:unknown protein [Microcystis aeruginosa NIES-843]|uniref:Uncharacterized protein n=1 Tax=Microcystis aeruginosa (strain NIES-843 / IAM M-2473) TaxID=449447 RepID=B0JYG3_MICAN|nr:unknown protein [Microcystis aeruginosa NIES-843]
MAFLIKTKCKLIWYRLLTTDSPKGKLPTSSFRITAIKRAEEVMVSGLCLLKGSFLYYTCNINLFSIWEKKITRTGEMGR